jgi:hypothetical protein
MSEDVFAVSDDRGGSPSSEEEQGLPLEEAIEQWWSNEIGHHEIY